MSENKNSDQLECERICKEVYTTTSALYEQRKSEMAERDYGYKILNGPPLAGPPILFLGYQPGGAQEDGERFKKLGAHERWPETLEYLQEGEHLLWTNVQRIF